MKRIYTIILFALFVGAAYSHDGHNHTELKEVTVPGLTTKNGEYTFKVKALYTASEVESPESGAANASAHGHELVTYKGWFKDRHCTWSLTPASVLTGSCSVACGTGGPTGQSMLNGCQAHGHGIWLNPTGEGSEDGRFLGFDAESAELLRAFLFRLHADVSTFNGKLYLEVSGYPVQIPASEDGKTAPVIGADFDRYIDGFHAVSVKGAVIGENQVFAENDYALTIDSLTPKNVTVETAENGYNIKFDAPVTASSLSPKFGVKAYEVVVYENNVIVDTRTAENNPAEPLAQITVTGLTVEDNHTFHIYSADGKLNIGYSEFFIALTDKDGNFVEDFTVSNFHPLMDMGMHKHSTPVSGVVEKVEIDGVTYYKTWNSFLMYTGEGGGTWTLDFDYTIGEKSGKVTGAVPQIDNYPRGGLKWLYTLTLEDVKHIFSLAAPKQLNTAGVRPVRIYLNKVADALQPYLPEDGCEWLLKATPFMVSMGHGSSSVDVPLAWNEDGGFFEGAINFGMEGDWRINLKLYNADGNTLIAGSDLDHEGKTNENSIWFDIWLENSHTGIETVQVSETKVFPTVSSGEINVITPANATVRLFDFTGRTIASYRSGGNINIRPNVGNGLYLVAVESKGQLSTHKIIVRK